VRHLPFSHRLTVDNVTPILSANCSCVSCSRCRSSLIISCFKSSKGQFWDHVTRGSIPSAIALTKLNPIRLYGAICSTESV
jgi:hypothetical protein